jgi:tetratricopeptide (TPR) repeat protein
LSDKLDQVLAAHDWAQAEDLAQQLISLDPAQGKFYLALGDAQLRTKKLEQAIHTYEQGVELVSKESDTPADPARAEARAAVLGKMRFGEGNAYLMLRKDDDAIRCYTKAAAVDPHPAIAYFNLCATLFNAGNDTVDAVRACDKSIAADPTRADTYFIKGSMLFAGSHMDAAGNFLVSPEGVAALNKYLELAPNGTHAADVKAMLDMAASNHSKSGKPD